MFPLLAILLIYVSRLIEPERHGGELFWLFLLGLFAWTLLEYGLHRFIFHIDFEFRNPKTAEFINGSHLSHHAAPRDPDKLLVKPAYGLTVSAILFGLAYLLSGSFFSASGIIAGISKASSQVVPSSKQRPFTDRFESTSPDRDKSARSDVGA